MKNSVWTVLLLSVAVVISVPAAAQSPDFASGRKADPAEADRTVTPATDMPAASAPRTRSGRSAGETGRSLGSGRTGGGPGMGMTGRGRDGSERRIEPSQRVLDSISGEDRAQTGRGVFGADDRRPVVDTTEYPYGAVGLVQATHPDPQITVNCTGALVGPKLLITAAHCLYDHTLEGGWIENVSFWAGINGNDKVPFGQSDWAEMYVFDGYIANYQDSYDSVWPYDLAVVILSEEVGNRTGWLGYDSFAGLGAFQASLIGYRADQTEWSQWSSACRVEAGNVTDIDFMHDCDADAYADAAPIYVHDASDDSYRIVGLNMNDLDDMNWALRLTEPMALWIDDMNRR